MLPLMDVEARFIVALCHRHRLDGKMALRRKTSAHLITMAALNFVLYDAL